MHLSFIYLFEKDFRIEKFNFCLQFKTLTAHLKKPKISVTFNSDMDYKFNSQFSGRGRSLTAKAHSGFAFFFKER